MGVTEEKVQDAVEAYVRRRETPSEATMIIKAEDGA